MQINEFIRKVAIKNNLTFVNTKKVVNCFLEWIKDELVSWWSVKIRNFWNFDTKVRKPRVCPHPVTREPMFISSMDIVYFKVSRPLRRAVRHLK